MFAMIGNATKQIQMHAYMLWKLRARTSFVAALKCAVISVFFVRAAKIPVHQKEEKKIVK